MHATALPFPNEDARALELPEPCRAVLETLRGEHLVLGYAAFAPAAGGWTAMVSRLDRPGILASMFFGQGLREVILCLDDGRRARARIASTSFVAATERICHLEGLEPLG